MEEAAPGTSRAAAKAAPKSKAAQRPKALPTVGIARFREAMQLIEDLVVENTDVFLASAARYRAAHATHAEQAARRLTHVEAAAAAAAFAREVGDFDAAGMAGLAADIQRSDIRAIDPPEQQELLLAAGLGTASGFIDAALAFVALVEMPKARFDEHSEAGVLRHAIDEDIATLKRRDVPVAEMRERALRAFEHFASAGGEDPGKAWSLITGMVRQALTTAMLAQESSGPSLSTASPTPTAGDSES